MTSEGGSASNAKGEVVLIQPSLTVPNGGRLF